MGRTRTTTRQALTSPMVVTSLDVHPPEVLHYYTCGWTVNTMGFLYVKIDGEIKQFGIPMKVTCRKAQVVKDAQGSNYTFEALGYHVRYEWRTYIYFFVFCFEK